MGARRSGVWREPESVGFGGIGAARLEEWMGYLSYCYSVVPSRKITLLQPLDSLQPPWASSHGEKNGKRAGEGGPTAARGRGAGAPLRLWGCRGFWLYKCQKKRPRSWCVISFIQQYKCPNMLYMIRSPVNLSKFLLNFIFLDYFICLPLKTKPYPKI